MEISIRHSLPGRVRLHVPVLRNPSPLAESTLSWINNQDWVNSTRVNYDCATLIIEYDKVHSDKLEEMLVLCPNYWQLEQTVTLRMT